jgi:hypothetical protein
MTCYTEELLDLALKQIVEDVGRGDITAIEELLQNVAAPALTGYLPEERAEALKTKWQIRG